MQAYKMVVTIDDPNRLVLTSLPFNRGQRVEVVLRDVDESSGALLAELKNLFAETQALPPLQTLTEEEIAAEIGAYRSGQ
jgi:hypothetical protein